MKKLVSIILCTSTLILLQISDSFAYLTEKTTGEVGWGRTAGTHNQFTRYSIYNLNFDSGIQKALKDNETAILSGNSQEDDEFISNALLHFYDPNWGDNQRGMLLFPSENAKIRARGYYDIAKKYYQKHAIGTAWERIGRALHLLQDMAVPAHVMRANHWQHATLWKNGYEWWVARNWDASPLYAGFLIKPYLDYLRAGNPYFSRPIMAGTMDGYMDAMAVQSRYGYEYDEAPLLAPVYSEVPLVLASGLIQAASHAVGDEEAKHTASVLIPSAIMVGGGLLQSFCKEVGCAGGPSRPAANNTNPGGNPDDNFDVSSRKIELEELDVTKQAWKDLYGRTGIKKGYNGLFLEKVIIEAYSKLAATTNETDYNLAAQQFGLVLDKAQKEAKNTFEETYYASADIAVLSDGFVDNTAELLLKRLKEPIREVKETFVPSALLPTQPVFVIPSGALSGFENSAIMKATLDEYVKQGGTLVVFAQAHGYDYAILPTPDGKPLTAYGWEEDINCFSDSLYIDTWHQMLSGQSRPTPTVNVDGYFSDIPAGSVVLMRRSANGQPSLIMYEHGQGRVIATTMYSDWAYGHGQASGEEIALVRDMLAWAKKPALLPEAKAGESANLTLTVTNTTATDAATIKLQVYNPDRSAMLSEQSLSQPLQTGQTANLPFAFQTNASGDLGIHHIDYILLDSQGNTIQPQAETDSGRFVVSKPPTELTKAPDFNFAVNSDSEHYARGSDATFTVNMYNHTGSEHTITAKYFFPHHYWESGNNPIYGGDWSSRNYNLTRTLTIPPKGSASFIHTQNNVWANIDRLWAFFYDENGKEVGGSSRGFYVFQPAVNVSVKTAKTTYAKGETVAITCNLQNKQNAQTPVKLRLKASDPSNAAVYINALDITLPPNAASAQNLTFALPATAQGGSYTISAETFDSSENKIGGDSASFELPLRLVTLTPNVPTAFNSGTNTISFSLANVGFVPVSTGIFDASLKDPDGAAIAIISQPFSIGVGENMNIDLPVIVPPLKFGTYTLSYTQSDETKTGKSTTVTLANNVTITASFDKPSYRIRETANLALTLTNSGRFNLDGLTITVAAPDAGYTDTKTVNIGQGQAPSLQYAIQLPEAIAAGQHGVTVTLTLPGGSNITKGFTITVPDALLSYALSQNTATAGGTANPAITNIGGKDTSVEYRLTLYDAKSAQIADKSATEPVQAGGTLPLAFQIPVGAADGAYTLVISYKDTKTGKSEIVQKPLTISGVKAALTVQTAKPTYLSTEGITALSNIINSGTLLQGGNLHLQVSTAVGSQKQKTWTSQFDFQQGVRDGVDTYGMNDWLIPDDDFDGVVLNTDRWTPGVYNYGTASWLTGDISTYVSINADKLSLNSPASTQTQIFSKWQLDGDFDIQVDFSNTNSVQQEGAEIGVHIAGYKVLIKNAKNGGYFSGIHDSNGNFLTSRSSGSGTYTGAGSFKIARNGTTVITYYKQGTNWIEHFRYTMPQLGGSCSVTLLLWAGQGYAATAQYDNFKVNSGRLKTENQALDSVRMLPLSDNFDDGVINTDRWSVRSSGSTTTNEANGNLVTKVTQAGAQSNSNVAGRFPLEGDFDISIDWKTPVAPASGDWGSIFQVSEVDQNTAPNNNLVGNALQIKRAYIDGVGHIYQTGHYNGNTWDSLSNPLTTTDTSGKFRIKRIGSLLTVWYWNNSLNRWEWNNNTDGYAWSGVWTTPAFVQMGTANNAPNNPVAETDWNNFKVGNGVAYLSEGTIRLKQDAGQTSNWQTISWNSTEPIGTSVKFRARTAESESDLASAPWVDYVTSGSPITNPKGRWIELEATLATMNATVTPLLNDVTATYGSSQGDILWQTDVPLNLVQGAVSDFTNTVGTLGNAGKYYLKGTVTSTTGQAVATYEYPFFVAQGNTALSFLPDKKVYKPGETVTITGEVKNLATVEAANLSLLLKGKPSGGVAQTLATETFTIPAGGSHPFTATTTAGAEGTVTLTGTVTQNGSTLAEIADQFEVTAPKITAMLTAPDTAGNDPFTMSLQLANSGKTDATVTIGKSFATTPETVTIPAGQTQLLQYPQQISADTAYTFTLTGDLIQSLSKAVKYGLAGSINITPLALYPEGNIAIPTTITNSGLLDGQFGVSYQLAQAANVVNQKAASYYITKGGNATDTLNYDLTEGAYQLTATGQLPALAATTSFAVRKEVKADLTQAIGAQNGTSLPVTATVSNLGFNVITGVARLSLNDAQGSAVWSAGQDVSLPQSLIPNPQSLLFTINLSAVKPGNYTIKTELLDSGNRQLAAQTAQFTLLAPIFTLTQTPPYQTFQPGANGTFTFKIKNSGNREGSCNLAFKAGDLSDSSRTEWLKPGEEKELSFTITLPVDLDEKDYNAVYRLTGNGITLAEDVVRYRLTGINLNVTASLDKQQYRPGESATLTLTVDQPAGAAPLEMFARVHYNDYDEKRSFVLSGPQSLAFTVPLATITGEKLFYGIYHQSGRSIHLNTTYVNAANDRLSITSDKQVYNPGETVAATITGSATGSMVLSGPGDFGETLAFNGSAARSLVLPADMLSGTYMITAQLTTQNSELITASHPIDVAGLKVTIKEARLDKTVYAATDTMKLTVAIESNQNLTAMLRTWVVDPAGTYAEAGSGDIALTAASPLISTLNSQLSTASAGIHKLVYGIYRGNELIVSGAKAFDIGNALVNAVATDKREYSALSEPVTIKTELFGTTTADLAIQLDGTDIQTTTVALSGFGSQTATLPAGTVTPGRHIVKAVLSSGGLASTRETEFVHGSALPDLTARLTAQPPTGQELLLTATVTNQGKSATAQSSLALYDGDPSAAGAVIAVLPIPALDAGASATVIYNWSVLGKAGEHLIYVVADSSNMVVEFDERNNSSWSSITLPSFVFSVTTGKNAYAANEEVSFSVALANLSPANTYPDAAVELKLTDPVGTIKNLVVKTLPLQPASAANFITSWNSASNMPGGYTLKGRLLSGTTELVAQEAVFAIQPATVITGNFTLSKGEVILGSALSIATTMINSGNVDVTAGELLAEIVDKAAGTTGQSLTQPFERLAVQATAVPVVSLGKVDVPPGDYLLRVTALTTGLRFSLGEQLLKVLPPLEITHGVDLSPRVLVFAGNDGDDHERHENHDDCEKHGHDRDNGHKHPGRVEQLIRQVLNGGGYYFKIVEHAEAFRRELRSGMYNSYILAGSRPLVDHLDRELGERINSGEGLILFGYDNLGDQKMRDLAGVKSEGRFHSAVRPMTLLPSPMTLAGSAQVEGAPLKLRLLSTTTQVAATVAEKRNVWPMIVLNTHGAGKVVVFASGFAGDLLGSALSYVAPIQGDGVPGAPFNATILLKSLGAPFDLHVRETVPASLPILSTRPLGSLDQHLITWPVTVAKDGAATLAYSVGLPESGGSYEASTEVAFVRNGSFETYKTIPHALGVERSLDDIRNDILYKLRNIQVDRKDAKELREALRRYETFLDMPDYSTQKLDKIIGQLLEIVEELREIGADTIAVRLDLGRLLKAYGRKWMEAEK